MGGSSRPEINDVVNLALLCGTGTTGCHGYVESHRKIAYQMGWLVYSWDDPRTVPWLPRSSMQRVTGVPYRA
jgi:hypothetical protein